MGNPPYNKEFTGKNGYAKPLYNEFVEKYIDISSYLLFIIPARWFVGGKGIDKFTNKMLKRKDIMLIKYFKKSSDVFGNSVIIKGGICYILKNSMYNGMCKFNENQIDLSKYDIIVDPEFVNLINRIIKQKMITELYNSKGYYGVSLTDNRLYDKCTDKSIKCYVSKIKGGVKYINRDEIEKMKLNNFKVITTTASSGDNECFGNTFVGTKLEIHSESYISFSVNTENEAKSLLSYLRCKLPNLLLKLRKITQNISEITCKWIPLPPLDREWTDKEVYKYFKLSNDEIKLIKTTKIIGYKDSE
jgi:site-specific DNA-methyltransferase (adenine-specific)